MDIENRIAAKFAKEIGWKVDGDGLPIQGQARNRALHLASDVVRDVLRDLPAVIEGRFHLTWGERLDLRRALARSLDLIDGTNSAL